MKHIQNRKKPFCKISYKPFQQITENHTQKSEIFLVNPKVNDTFGKKK